MINQKYIVSSALAILILPSCVSAISQKNPKADIDLYNSTNTQTGKKYCPDYIYTSQQIISSDDNNLDKETALLNATPTKQRHNLDYIDIYGGPASSQTQLKPEIVNGKNRYVFSKQDTIHYVCKYVETSVTLDAPLDKNIAYCEASNRKDKFGGDTAQLICKHDR
jgi:hypothetical protein